MWRKQQDDKKGDYGINGAGRPDPRESILWVLTAATFLIFFQAYMIAPLIQRFSNVFKVSNQTIGLALPAYMIPYGLATLFYGLLSDKLGQQRIMLISVWHIHTANCVYSRIMVC